jgi:hypothetical protein
MLYIFFLENFIDGIIPPIRPKKPLYKGGYGRGEGVPIPYRGVYGGSDYYIRGSGCNIIKKGNYCPPSIVSDSIMKSSSSVGPLSVSEGEEQELPHCSHLQLQLYVLCVVVFVHPINKRDAKSVNKMFLILYKYIWWLILFAISLCWCFIVWGKYISRVEYTRSRM